MILLILSAQVLAISLFPVRFRLLFLLSKILACDVIQLGSLQSEVEFTVIIIDGHQSYYDGPAQFSK